MRACTFVSDATVGRATFRPGDSAVLPEAFVRALERRGLVATPASVAVPPEPPGESPAAVVERTPKLAPLLSKRGLRKLLKRKA